MTAEGHTLLILTDAESRLIRKALHFADGHDEFFGAAGAFNRGITRGTAKLAEEFAARQKAKKQK